MTAVIATGNATLDSLLQPQKKVKIMARRPFEGIWEEDFWAGVLSAPKVKRILEGRGFSPACFRSNYIKDTRRCRRPKRPTAGEMTAVEKFLEIGDFELFQSSLGVTTAAIANSVLSRVVRFKALGGRKTTLRTPKT